jgi:hypothetical protein
MRTAVSEGGTTSGSGLDATAQHLGTGDDYLVTFNFRSAAGCIYSATFARVGGVPTFGNRIEVESQGTGVRVRTYFDTTPEDNGFHLTVACS